MAEGVAEEEGVAEDCVALDDGTAGESGEMGLGVLAVKRQVRTGHVETD